MLRLIAFMIVYMVVILIKITVNESKQKQDRIYQYDAKGKYELEDQIEKRIIRNEALDEVSIRCRMLTKDRELPYLEVDEVEKVIRDIKKGKGTK